MKKVLNTLLVLALIFTMVSPAFAAADTTQQKFDELKAAGVISGDANGNMLAIDSTMDRQMLAKIACQLMGVAATPGVEVAAFAGDYKQGVWGFDQGWVQAAYNAGLMKGKGAAGFDATGTVTVGELITVIIRSMGLADQVDASKVWPAGEMALAVSKGLIPAAGVTASEDATYAALVTQTYNAYTHNNPVIEATTMTAQQTGVKEVTVALDGIADDSAFVLNRGLVSQSISEVEWNDSKTEATLTTTTKLLDADYTLTFGDLEAEFTAVPGKATTIELLSNDVIVVKEDLTKATVGFVIYNQFGEDITKTESSGDYNLTASPDSVVANFTTKKLTFTDVGTDWKHGESKIVVTVVNIGTGAVLNQVVTVQEPSKLASFTLFGVENIHEDAVDQVINQGDTAASGDDYFWVINYEAVDQYGNAINTVDYFDGADNNFALDTDNPLTLNVGTSGGTTVEWAADPSDSDIAVLQVEPGAGTTNETVIVTLVDKFSGANDQLTFKVEKPLGVVDFTMSTPAGLIVQDEKVVIPYQAFDQYGEEVTNLDLLNNIVFTKSQGTTPVFTKNPASGVITLVYTPSADGVALITSTIGTEFDSLQLTVDELAIPTYVSAVDDDVALNLAKDAEADLDEDSFVIKDQYNREIDLGTYDGVAYDINIDEVDVDNDNVTMTAAGNSVTLTGTTDYGSKVFNVNITAAAVAVDASDLTFTAKSISKANITEYVLDVADLVYDGGTAYVAGTTEAEAYQEDYEVYGLTASGDKVSLAAADVVSITSTNGNLVVDDTNELIYGDGLTEAGEDEVGTIVVVINGANGTTTVTKTVTITDAKPVPGELTTKVARTAVAGTDYVSFADGVAVLTVAQIEGENGNYVSSAYQYSDVAGTRSLVYFEVLDQYGVAASSVDPIYYTLTATDAAGDAITIGTYAIDATAGDLTVTATEPASGDKVVITAIMNDGTTAKLTIIVQ